jgi:hypothetical protein
MEPKDRVKHPYVSNYDVALVGSLAQLELVC